MINLMINDKMGVDMQTDWIIMSKEFEDPSSLGPKKKEEKGRGGRLFIFKRELRNTGTCIY